MRVPMVRVRILWIVIFVLSTLQWQHLAVYSQDRSTHLRSQQIVEGVISLPPSVDFMPHAPMIRSREGHTATLLPDGAVLVTGGQSANPPEFTLSAEVYDAATQSFTLTTSMKGRRDDHTSTLLDNGRILITGGYTRSAELYVPATNSFVSTGMMSVQRSMHTATLLPSGRVLLAGGNDGSTSTRLSELYDPVTQTFINTGLLINRRYGHTATLLLDGTVLITGGFRNDVTILSDAELYDPITGVFTPTGMMTQIRARHTATLLPDGRVLIAGGMESITSMLQSAELYDPLSKTFTAVPNGMIERRGMHTASLTSDGLVLLVGGLSNSGWNTTVEAFDPITSSFLAVGHLNQGRYGHTTTSLADTQLLVAGGFASPNSGITANTELGTYSPPNTLTGTMALPTGWINTRHFTLSVRGSSAKAPLQAGRIRTLDDQGPWFDVTPGITMTQEVTLTHDGMTIPVALALQDIHLQEGIVVTGMVNIDTAAPTSSMIALPATSPRDISLSWEGSDTLSGIATYDVEMRTPDGAWEPVVINTPAHALTVTGIPGQRYFFRVRATDAAGNVEDWSDAYDAVTQVFSMLFLPSLIR